MGVYIVESHARQRLDLLTFSKINHMELIKKITGSHERMNRACQRDPVPIFFTHYWSPIII